MSYADLSPDVQNIVMTNFEFFGKFALIVGLFIFCYSFVSRFNKRDKSPYFAVRYMKGITFYVSKVYMFFFPMTIFLMYPQIPLDNVLILMVSAYSILFSIIGFIIVPINVLLFGASFAEDFFNVPLGGQKVRKEFYQVIGQKDQGARK